jgi:hypothetical protein
LKLIAKNVAGGDPRPAMKLLDQHLSKKAGNLDLNDYTHADRLWESTLRRRPVFNPEDLSRAFADLAVSGARNCASKAYVSRLRFATPWFEPPVSRALPILKTGTIWW